MQSWKPQIPSTHIKYRLVGPHIEVKCWEGRQADPRGSLAKLAEIVSSKFSERPCLKTNGKSDQEQHSDFNLWFLHAHPYANVPMHAHRNARASTHTHTTEQSAITFYYAAMVMSCSFKFSLSLLECVVNFLILL